MSRLGFKTVVHHGELRLGELEAIPTRDQNFQFPSNEIRIRHISQKTERSPPLAVLQTISSFSVLCKLESTLPVEQPHLINLHACCYYEGKTAVAVVGDQEIHLVAMPSKQKKFPCFWCYSVPLGLYSACLGMLNMRCLSIVFDLDETLIVANTMKSFDDRIDALRSWIGREVDEMRIAGMSAEMKRYAEDRALLKQYIDNDSVADNAKVFKIQLEEVPPVSENHEKIVRPIIRMPEKNIVLTRINPEIRDTSVLVRLRPAWEDLRSYLIAKGRKRFEVYVCTMAERDYALEMWRLLDPEAHLIGSKQLKDRVVCVKPDSRKSLLNVFQHGVCHPKMAMVIDDRSKVWEDKDQPRVHVVPAFTPYYAPQAETASPVPILCVARNVACNVRGSFFRDFDELLLRKFNEVFYEDDIVNLPPALDVSNYLMPEDTGPALNGNTNAPIREGMNGSEVEQRLNQANDKGGMESVAHFMKNHAEVRYQNSQAPVTNFPHVVGVAPLRPVLPSQKPGLRPPVRRDFFYDRDYDMKRGLIGTNSTLDRGQNSAEAPVQSRVSVQTPPSSSVRAQGGWLVDDVQQPDGLKLETRNPFTPFTPGSTPTGLLAHKSDVKREEVSSGRDLQKQNLSLPSQLSEASVSHNQASSLNRESYIEFGKVNPSASLSISALQEIARMCSSKIEFRSVLNTSNDLQFSVEVLLTGEKVGFGMGRTRKDAQQQAAENALLSLSDNYVAFITPRAGAVDRDVDKGSENGFLLDVNGPGSAQLLREGGLPKESTSEAAEVEPGHPITVSQKGQKRASSPRFLQSGGPNKRFKEDIP